MCGGLKRDEMVLCEVVHVLLKQQQQQQQQQQQRNWLAWED